MIGEKIEKPDIITKLLDTKKFTERPGYQMERPEGLILFDCKYQNLQFHTPKSANNVFLEKLILTLYNSQLVKLKMISSIAQNYKESVLRQQDYKITKTKKKKLKRRKTIEETYKNHIFGKNNKMIKPSKEKKGKNAKTKKIKKERKSK